MARWAASSCPRTHRTSSRAPCAHGARLGGAQQQPPERDRAAVAVGGARQQGADADVALGERQPARPAQPAQRPGDPAAGQLAAGAGELGGVDRDRDDGGGRGDHGEDLGEQRPVEGGQVEAVAGEQPVPGRPVVPAHPERRQPARRRLAPQGEHAGDRERHQADEHALLAGRVAVGRQQRKPGGGQGRDGRRGIMRGHRGLLGRSAGSHRHPTEPAPAVNPPPPLGQT